MKLELKHLAPYLPYELGYIKRSQPTTICELIGLSEKSATSKGEWRVYNRHTFSSQLIDYENIKPILRPLSDIKETICVNDEPFVPINELAIKLYDREPESFDCQNSCIAWIQTMVYNKVIEPKGYDDIPHWIYQDLIKWHFDLFGLIPENLAININTI